MKALTLVLAPTLAFLPVAASAQLTPGPNDVYVRVVDGGPALCTITRVPGNHFMVYDAGHWIGTQCLDAVTELVGTNDIDLLILSHNDGDHIGQASEIIDAFTVQRIIWTGEPRMTRSWQDANAAIVAEGAQVTNLQVDALPPGTAITLGNATVTIVAGWGQWVGTGPSAAERHNVISIVARLDYQGSTVLYTGDTIGRRRDDNDAACKDAELFMVQNTRNVPIGADVLLAPHHGGNNGSSSCFIEAVEPEFVIFSSGHAHDHPSRGAARRYLEFGVDRDNMFRTDFGDDEGGFEWDHGRQTGCIDGRGDEDVEIVLRQNGTVEVAYRSGTVGC